MFLAQVRRACLLENYDMAVSYVRVKTLPLFLACSDSFNSENFEKKSFLKFLNAFLAECIVNIN